MPGVVDIVANGEARTVPEGCTLESFLKSLELPGGRGAVERNGAVVPKDRFGAVVLAAGDKLEIVTLVGGG